MSARDEVVDALIAERYGPSLWWKTPAKEQQDDEPNPDDDVTTARRRRQLDREAS